MLLPQGPYFSIVIWLAVLAGLIAIGIYVIGKFRDTPTKRAPQASELITNFQQLHDRGELSDAEYRTIKAMLAERLQNELNESGDST